MRKKCALIDTCVLLSDPGVLSREANIGKLILTNTVLDEIDFNKKNSDIDIAKNARQIIKKFRLQSPEEQAKLPCGKPLRNGDTLSKYEFNGASVFVLNREKFRFRPIDFNDTNSLNDAKIREVAKDYDFELFTEDGGNKIQAELKGIKATIWNSKAKKRRASESARLSKQGSGVSCKKQNSQWVPSQLTLSSAASNTPKKKTYSVSSGILEFIFLCFLWMFSLLWPFIAAFGIFYLSVWLFGWSFTVFAVFLFILDHWRK